MRLFNNFDWNEDKNKQLISERGIGFEEVAVAIQHGHLLDVIKEKEPKYSHQNIFVVFVDGYTYAVPFVENAGEVFLKTIYPSRILHKQYDKGAAK